MRNEEIEFFGGIPVHQYINSNHYFIYIYFRKSFPMEAIRKIQFMFKGYNNFTKNSKKFPTLTPDLTGKNFVITGANSGIGYEAAKFAANQHAKVFLVCRSP